VNKPIQNDFTFGLLLLWVVLCVSRHLYLTFFMFCGIFFLSVCILLRLLWVSILLIK
jgi:hypothetical protein